MLKQLGSSLADFALLLVALFAGLACVGFAIGGLLQLFRVATQVENASLASAIAYLALAVIAGAVAYVSHRFAKRVASVEEGIESQCELSRDRAARGDEC